ncbi:hypothetical protein LTR16_003296 [Cryomyces antarcticus]|uniref:Helicase C-terminal domain-containing protein n=1 Tax=Cryomyces antarcticus TaxID=329879 RepID=A0ABR0KSK1_9PEZI|nr:hypothetical protein LTR39_002482 [Cryomyces antarcticus]KAK5016212.1 hypothetical protein LTR60_002511 [Cryomyces antarcticus]KAK5125565.1 hypothetical protein LTR16_003296 [Cryomyces antarcticus]
MEGALRILVMEDMRRALPSAEVLRNYDVILFSRTRFEHESRDGSDDEGRRLTSSPAICSYDLYSSPLKQLHFLRIIIDEGHSFSSPNTNAARVADKLVRADYRWVVSGTPAKDLLGVEMDLAAIEGTVEPQSMTSLRDLAVEQRKQFSLKEESSGAAKSLGLLASHFLKVRPWAGAGIGEKPAEWEEYIYRHEHLRRRTSSGFSLCFRNTLEAMVVKTRPEDVDRDIELPPLSHRIVRLEPSFYDKLIANVFVLVLTANAVTSERTDADYLFHKNSQKPRYQLIANLRQSAFFWTGFSKADVAAAMEHSIKYLTKQGTSCTEEDRQLLNECVTIAGTVLQSQGWESMSKSHEMGLFLQEWPAESVDFWAFGDSREPLLTGVSQALQAQAHVNGNLHSADPSEGLPGIGLRALASLRAEMTEGLTAEDAKNEMTMKMGVLLSSIHGEPPAASRPTLSVNTKKISPKRSSTIPAKRRTSFVHDAVQKKLSSPDTGLGTSETAARPVEAHYAAKSTNASLRKRTRPVDNQTELSMGSPLSRTQVVGTTSAKLSYLLDRVMEFHEEEKILIFYDGENSAYYIAQALELLDVPHLIYAKTLTAQQRSEYIVVFDQDEKFRVLLMDVKQAAYGLNLSSASRVFFVNPVCRPNIEAQAIKRAHRIGQTRPVKVETLVLEGTIEEAMLERANAMTRYEHFDAKTLEDDEKIQRIIQQARVVPVDLNDATGYGQMAMLQTPQQLFGRPNRGAASFLENPFPNPFSNTSKPSKIDSRPTKRQRQKRSAEPSSFTYEGSDETMPSSDIDLTLVPHAGPSLGASPITSSSGGPPRSSSYT